MERHWWGWVIALSPLTVGLAPGATSGAVVSGSGVAGLVVGDKVLVLQQGTAHTVLIKNHPY